MQPDEQPIHPGSRIARYPALWLAAATVVCLLPWLNKAFDFDDPLFLWSAERILDNPLDFYSGQVNWYGTTQLLGEVIKNPPLNSFYLALVGWLCGFNEVPLHAAMLVWPVATIVGTYFLAARLCSRPAFAAAATLAMPVLLVSSSSVMCDTPMLALWIWSLLLWLRGVDDHQAASLLASSLLMAACALTKYFGIALVPLAILYAVLHQRGASRQLLYLLIPVTACAAFELYFRQQYHQSAFFDAASYAARANVDNPLSLTNRGLIGLLFAGGCLLPVALCTPWLWSGRVQLVWLLLAAGVAAALAYRGQLPFGTADTSFLLRDGHSLRWERLLLATLFAVAGLQVIALVAADLFDRRDASAGLLAAWVVGTLVFAAWINWTTNGRSILPAAPAVAMLLARRLGERRPREAADPTLPTLSWLPLAGGLTISMLLCWADTQAANAGRQAVQSIASRHTPATGVPHLWFTGHWGFQYYAQRQGWFPLDQHGSELDQGDLLVEPGDAVRTDFPPEWRLVDRFEEPLFPLAATSSRELQISLYTSLLGPMPYYFGRVPSRPYRVYDPFAALTSGS